MVRILFLSLCLAGCAGVALTQRGDAAPTTAAANSAGHASVQLWADGKSLQSHPIKLPAGGR